MPNEKVDLKGKNITCEHKEDEEEAICLEESSHLKWFDSEMT